MCEVKVINGADIPDEEKRAYIDYITRKYHTKPKWVDVKLCGEEVELKFELERPVPFERIRRITGYLVGTLDRFNDGKRAEEHDRVKHEV